MMTGVSFLQGNGHDNGCIFVRGILAQRSVFRNILNVLSLKEGLTVALRYEYCDS